MAGRVVTGEIRQWPADVPWAGAVVLFELTRITYDDTAEIVYPRHTQAVVCDGAGQFSIELATAETGNTTYLVTLPDGQRRRVRVPAPVVGDDGPLALQELVR